jgi:hypothetical protein
MLLGPRLTTVSIALVLVYNNGGLVVLGGTDHVLVENTTKLTMHPKPLVAREYTIGDTSALYEKEYNDNGERIRGERLFTRATID